MDNDVTRYSTANLAGDDMHPHPLGEWVDYDDHAAALADLIASQKAEMDRLREALAEIKGIGCGHVGSDVNADKLRVACGNIAHAALSTRKDSQ